MDLVSQLPVPVEMSWPSREATQFLRVNGTLTGNISASGNMLDLWTPSAGHRVILKGGRLGVLVTTELAANGADFLMLLDSDVAGGCVDVLCAFGPTDLADTLLRDPTESFALMGGEMLAAKDRVLRLGSNQTIGTGVIRVSGILWGEEVAL